MNSQQQISPFKFLDSYTEQDRDIFFGREPETENIYQKVFQSKLLLVYGASGTGKSSLINCGLANMFMESDWLPIHVRRLGNIRRSLFEQINKQAVHPVSITEEEKMTNSGLEKVISSVFMDHFKPIYLIFDQFEELFIFGNKEEWKNFIAGVKFLIERDLEVHFIFVLRGEYLEFLSEFEDIIPEFFDNRIRIEKMTRKTAEFIVENTTKQLDIRIEDGFEEKLIKKLNPEKTEVELTFLQVFLDRIYKESICDEGVVFKNETIDQLGQVGDILAEFVDEQLFKMEDPKTALSVLKSFVSLQGTKTRRSIDSVNQYVADLGNKISIEETGKIITQFVDRRILKERDENGLYELRHDSIAQKVYEKITNTERELLEIKQFLTHSFSEYEKRQMLLSDEDINYIQPYLKRLNLSSDILDFISKSINKSGKKKRQRNIFRLISIIIILLTLASAYGFFTAQQQKEKAEQMATLAQKETKRTEEQKNLAEQQKAEAERQANIAKEQRRLAEEQQKIAEQAKAEAENQKEQALTSRDEAAYQKTLVEREREKALISAAEAKKQAALASEEKEKAEKLRMLSLAKEIAVKSRYYADPVVKGLAAVQAYQFNMNFGGKPHADFYHALYDAAKSLDITDHMTLKIHSQPIMALVQLEEQIWTTSADGKIVKSSWSNGHLVNKTVLNYSHPFQHMVSSKDQQEMFLSDLNSNLFVFNIQSEKLNLLLKLDQDIMELKELRDEIYAITRSGQILRVKGQVKELARELDKTITACFLADDHLWVAADAQILRINLNNWASSVLKEGLSHEVTAMTISSSKNQLALGFDNGEILLINLKDSSSLKLSGHTAAITDLQMISDHQLASTSYDRSVRLWPLVAISSPPVVIQDRNSWISRVIVSPDQGYFYTGEYDGTIRAFLLKDEMLSDRICKRMDRNLLKVEWEKYVSPDIDYSLQTSCSK